MSSPVRRWNVLNNEGKTVNIFREYAANPSTRINWVAGHGVQLNFGAKVPPNTFLIFMGAPGQYASQSILPWNSRAYRNLQYMRDVFAGRVTNILPTRLGYWKQHVYGPGDVFPELMIDMWDYNIVNIGTQRIARDTPGTPFDRVCGIKDMNRGIKFLYKKSRTISQLLRRGPGIYLIMSCRASMQRIESGTANRDFVRTSNRLAPLIAQARVPRIQPTEAVNFGVQTHENRQARVTTRKRAMTTRPRNRTTTKRRETEFTRFQSAMPVFTFHPGKVVSSRRRPV